MEGIVVLVRVGVIFQVLQFPGLRFGPSFSRSCIFQSLFFVVRHFQVLQIQRPRGSGGVAPSSEFFIVCKETRWTGRIHRIVYVIFLKGQRISY